MVVGVLAITLMGVWMKGEEEGDDDEQEKANADESGKKGAVKKQQ